MCSEHLSYKSSRKVCAKLGSRDGFTVSSLRAEICFLATSHWNLTLCVLLAMLQGLLFDAVALAEFRWKGGIVQLSVLIGI